MNKDELKSLRLSLNLTQPQLAEKLGVTRDAIAKYESGKTNMRKSVAMLAESIAKGRDFHIAP